MSRILEIAEEMVRLLKEQEAQEDVAADKEQLGDIAPGETFEMCDHEFIVLQHKEGNTKVICKDFWEADEEFGNSTDYKESAIRVIMEDDALPEIEKAVGPENIVEHEVDLISVDMQRDAGTLKCKVRPITFDEVREFNELIANKDLDDWFWTCTPWSTKERGWEYSVAVVSPSGSVCSGNCDSSYGVRPVLYLKSNIFVSRKGA